MSGKQLGMVLKEMADGSIPPNSVDLWPGVRKEMEGRMSLSRKPALVRQRKAALPVGISIVVLTLALIVVGPDRALAALRNLLGYIPGIGLVDEVGGLRVLAAPVVRERDGITVTVEQVVMDSGQTVLIYSADNISPEVTVGEQQEQPRDGGALAGIAACSSRPYLRLPDGSVLTLTAGQGSGWASGYRERLVFAAIPADVEEAVFTIPCLLDASPGAAPENWALELVFVDAPPDLMVMPVLDVALETSADEVPSEERPSGFTLENVITLEESYILTGTFQAREDFPGGTVVGTPFRAEITDGDGRPLPYSIPSDLDLVGEDPGTLLWAYEVNKGFAGPLTIQVESLDVEYPIEAVFQFDTGETTVAGQEWILNQEFEFAGYRVELISAVRTEEGYRFDFIADSPVFGVMMEDADHASMGGYGGGQGGAFFTGFEYADPPAGRLRYHISGIMVRETGSWGMTWMPPEAGASAAESSSAAVCIVGEDWSQAEQNAARLTDVLAGRVIVYGRIVEDGERLSPFNAGIFVMNLADGERSIIGPGTWGSLSSDGTRAAYSGSDALHVVDLDTGENRMVPGTSSSDYNPHWSPDGTRLAFVRNEDRNLYVVRPDGTGLQRVTEENVYELLVGWMPDGETLAYVFPAAAGLQLRYVNLISGEQQDGFIIDAKVANAAISPDGRQIAFVARVEGGMYYELLVADLDGANRRSILQLGPWALGDPRWSPDGSYISLNITDPDPFGAGTTTIVIDPNACEVLPLSGIEGYTQGWVR